MAVLWVDHAFDSLKAISAYKGDQMPGMPHTNQKNSNFNRRTNLATPAKGASTQTSPHTPYNTQLNSTLTKQYNNYSNNNYSNNKYTGSGSTQKNHSYSNYNKDDRAKDTKLPNTLSKLPLNQGWPSNDKAGNPICYKCGKIGFTRDCPRHLYKPRVFTLGINGNLIEAGPEPQEQQTEGEEEPSPKDDPTKSPEGIGVEDQYIDDPYDPIHFKFVEEEDETFETQDKSLSFKMLSFVDNTDEAFIV